MAVKFANLASSTLASSLTNSATSISVSDASSFPTLGAGDYFYASIGEGTLSEIVKVTAVSSNTFTAVRGQDGTTARSHDSGTSIALRVVAAALDDIASAADTESVSISGDTMTGNLTVPSLIGTNAIVSNVIAKGTNGNILIKTNGGSSIARFNNDLSTNFFGHIITNTSSRIENGRISMEADGTLDWGASKDSGTLTWDTGKIIVRGQTGKAIEFQTNGSSLAATFDTSQNATFNGSVNVSGDLNISSVLAHTGDLDTYFQFSAANTARIVVGGSQKFVVNTNGVSINNGTLDMTSNNISNVGSISAAGINNATGEVIDLNHSTYTIIKNPENAVALYLGDSGDAGNYYQNNAHHFRKTDGSTYMLTVQEGATNIRTGSLQMNGSEVIDSSRNITAGTISGTLVSSVTATTQSASDNSTKVATTAYVDSAVSGIVDSAPGTLNTLNELAAALGDDANFSTTVTNSIATKLPLAGGTMTGTIDSHVGDSGVILQSGNSSATGTPDQFKVNHNLGNVEIRNLRGSINFPTVVNFTNINDINVNGTLNLGTSSTSNHFTGHYYHNRYSNNNVYVHYYPNGNTTNSNTYFRFPNGSSFRALAFEGANMDWAGTISSGAITSSGNITAGSGNQLRLTKALTSSDFDAVRIAYTGSWSGYQNYLAGIHVVNADNDTSTMGRFGITYGSGGGSFVVTDLYDGGFGASGEVFRVRGNGNVETYGPIYADYSVLGRGIRTANRGELHLNATGANDVSELMFGYGNGYTENQIRFGISDRGGADDRLVFYKGPYHSGWTEMAHFDATDNSLTVNGPVNAQNLFMNDVNGTVDSRWGIYVWDQELQFTTRNISTNAYIAAPMVLRNDDNSARFTGPIWVNGDKVIDTNRFATFYSGTSTGDLSVGRSSAQRFQLHVTDGTGYIRYYQDETNATDHSVRFEIQSGSSGTNKFYFNRPVEISGAITTSGTISLPSSHTKQKIVMYGGGHEWIGTSTSTLELSGASINLNGAQGTGTPNFKMGNTTVIDSAREIKFTKGSSGTLASRTGFSDFIGYNPSYGSYIGGGANNGNSWIYSGGYISQGGVHTLWHSGNDGSGSGLDADTLDSNQATHFTHYRGIVSGNWDTIFTTGTGKTQTSGLYEVHNLTSGSHSNYPSGAYTYGGVFAWNLGSSTFKLYAPHVGNLYYQTGWNNDEYSGWRKIWDNGNDGPGSGLDADTVDGIQGSLIWQKQGSWYGDLGSNGYDRVQGATYTGGEFVLVEKNAQISTLIDGAYLSYEGGNGFFHSYNSSYGNLTGIQATSADTLTVKQLDGGNAHLHVTNDFSMGGNVWSGNTNANEQATHLNRVGGIRLGWSNSSYGVQNDHSIRSTYGNTYGDNITINSYNHLRFNIDSNNNNPTSYFEVGDGTTGTGNLIFRVDNNAHMTLGRSGLTPQIDMMYTDHGSGAGWDTRIFIGKTNDLPNGAAFPTSTAAGGYGVQFQANSDGCFYGVEEWTTGNYRPLINWGDDTSDSPFRIAFNNSTRFQMDASGNFTANGNVTAYSDAKLKDNVEEITDALEKVSKIRGVTYTRNDQKDTETRHMGVIAQEVEAAGVSEVVQYDAENDIKTVAYGNMVGLLIEAIKEQQAQIEALRAEIGFLKEK